MMRWKHTKLDTKAKTHNLELGGGLEDSDGGDRLIVMEEREEQVGAKGGGTRGGRLHDTQSLL